MTLPCWAGAGKSVCRLVNIAPLSLDNARVRLTKDSLSATCFTHKLNLRMHNVDLSELQNVVGKYVDQYHLVVAGGPLAATAAVKAFVVDNKAVNVAVTASTVWFVVKEISSPMLHLITDQFDNLQSVFGMFRG